MSLPENVIYRAFRSAADDIEECTLSYHQTSDGAKLACQSTFDDEREDFWPDLPEQLEWDTDEDTGSIYTPKVDYLTFWVEQLEVLP